MIMGENGKKRTWLKETLAVFFGLCVLAIIPLVSSEYITILLTRALILAIVAVSLNILIGNTGLGHIGHAAFFAVGAYTAAILEVRYHWNFLTILLFSGVMPALFAAAAGLLLLRAAGLVFLMISLAIAMCIWGLIYRWVSLTGGDNGITGIPRPHLGIPLDLAGTTNFYYFVMFFFILALILMVMLIRSPFGKTLLGIRDSESRMKVLGYDVWLHKYLVLIITSAFAGIAGNLYVYFNTFIGPNVADLGSCMDFVLMMVIGGIGTIVGPILGSVIIVLLKELVSVYTERWLLFLGIAYVITATYAPEGIVGLWRDFIRRWTMKLSVPKQ